MIQKSQKKEVSRLIDLDKIIEKYEKGEDDRDKPTSAELGIDQEDFREHAEELVEDLKTINADLDWWTGDKTTHELGVLQLGSEPPLLGPSKEEVIDLVGLDREIVKSAVEGKTGSDFSIIWEKVDPDGLENAIRTGSIPSIIKEAINQFLRLRESDPKDKPLWVARMLKGHGKSKVSVREWFRADWLFDRILKAEVAKKFEEYLERSSEEMK